MATYEVETSYEMMNGQTLYCRYDLHVTEGCYYGPPEFCYPDQTDASEPSYFIDEDEVEYEKLPKGLDVIADKLYHTNSSQYGYKETEKVYDDGLEYDDIEDY